MPGAPWVEAIDAVLREIIQLKAETVSLRNIVETKEAATRAKNLVFYNIPFHHTEDLCELVIQIAGLLGITLRADQLRHVFRGSATLIVAKFHDVATRNAIWRAGKLIRLTHQQLGFSHRPLSPVLISDDKSPYLRWLFAEAKVCCRYLNWQFVWCYQGRVYLRRNLQSLTIHVSDIRIIHQLLLKDN